MSHIEFEGDDVPIFDMNGARLSLRNLADIAEIIEQNGGIIVQRCKKNDLSLAKQTLEDYALAYARLQQALGTDVVPNGGSFAKAIQFAIDHLDSTAFLENPVIQQ